MSKRIEDAKRLALTDPATYQRMQFYAALFISIIMAFIVAGLVMLLG